MSNMQQNLTECNDLYTLECCTIGGTVWTATAGYRDPMPWAKASRVAEELTLLSERVMYRPVLAQV